MFLADGQELEQLNVSADLIIIVSKIEALIED